MKHVLIATMLTLYSAAGCKKDVAIEAKDAIAATPSAPASAATTVTTTVGSAEGTTCAKNAWTGSGHHLGTPQAFVGKLRVLHDKGVKSAVLMLSDPICDWNAKPVGEVELQGEEGSDILGELATFAGRLVSVQTNSVYEALVPHSRRSIWATYTAGSLKALDTGKTVPRKGPSTELAIRDPSAPNEGIFACAGGDIVVVLPQTKNPWTVTTVDPRLGIPKIEPRPGFLPAGANTAGIAFRWSTAKLAGGRYEIRLSNGSDKIIVPVVLACDD